MKKSSTPSPRKFPSPGPSRGGPASAPERGEVWWVRLDPTLGSEISKTRPCLVLTSSVVNRLRRTVVVVPLSTSPQAIPPLLISIECAGRIAVAVTDQIRAVAKERLQQRLATVSAGDLRAVEEGIRQILEL